MVSKVFYSNVTGKPLENPVVFDGWLCDKTEAELILSLQDPVLNLQNKIVSRSTIGHGSARDLTWVKTALQKHQGLIIPANFLQPMIDAAYNESAWPRPSALRQYNLIMSKQSADHVSQPDVLAWALNSLFEKSVKAVNDNSLSMEISVTPKNKRYAAVLKKYGVIGQPTETKGNDPKMTISGLNLRILIEQAESARVMMLNMRRVLMSNPKNLATQDIKLQQKLINSIDVLDKPLLNKEGNAPLQTASIQDALALLNTFSQVQNISSTRIYSNDSANDAWHLFVAENEQYNGIHNYIAPFEAQYKTEISAYTTYDNVDALIKNGELARKVLLQLKSLSEKQEDMGFSNVYGHDWSSELKAQRALVDSLGSQKDGADIDASVAKRLSESLLYSHIPEATRIERAKIYTDTLKAIYDISRKAVTTRTYIVNPKAGEKVWHNLIAQDESFDPANIYMRVESKARGVQVAMPTFTLQNIVNPFEDYVTRHPESTQGLSICSLSGHPTQVPVIFLDGYVYDGNALHAYLMAGNRISPRTGVDYSSTTRSWNLSELHTILPVSQAIVNVNNAANLQGDQEGFVLPSAPPADGFWNNRPVNLDYTQTANNTAQNNMTALSRLIQMDATYTLTGDLITITPNYYPETGMLGTYEYYHDNQGKNLYWKDVQEKMTQQLDYLKDQGIISSYTYATGNVKQVTLFGFNQHVLLQKANDARKLLLAVKTATETDNLFERRVASIPLLKSAQRTGMNRLQDNGQLPDHVHYQHRNIVGESSRLSPQTRNTLATEIRANNLTPAFECLACAKEVIVIGAQGARGNPTSYLNPSMYARTGATCDWYNIFQSNIEKRFTGYGHYETTKDTPYNFAAMETAVTQWAETHKPQDNNRLAQQQQSAQQ